jgi:RNA recognition motif-containing protein
MNQIEFGKKHLRVDVDYKEEGAHLNDYESTVFVGNMPWVINEEDVRKHFQDCGKI